MTASDIDQHLSISNCNIRGAVDHGRELIYTSLHVIDMIESRPAVPENDVNAIAGSRRKLIACPDGENPDRRGDRLVADNADARRADAEGHREESRLDRDISIHIIAAAARAEHRQHESQCYEPHP